MCKKKYYKDSFELLYLELAKFNAKYFPSPEYKRKVAKGAINEDKYANEKEKEFLKGDS